jgi:hypothetical protein
VKSVQSEDRITKAHHGVPLLLESSWRAPGEPRFELFRFTIIALQVYAFGDIPAAEDGGLSKEEDGGLSKNYLSGNLCQQE